MGHGSCIASCEALGNNPSRIGMVKVGPIKVGDKPKIEFTHYPLAACNECAYCMEMFNKKGTTPCVINCPSKAIRIAKLEELPKLLADRKSGEGLYIQIFK